MGFTYITQKEDAAPAVLPAGEYNAVIIKSEEMVSKSSGRNMLKLELDTGKGHLWEYLSEGDMYLGSKIAHILSSAGIFAPGMRITASTFKGLKVRVRVKQERNDDGELKAKIERWLPHENNAMQTAPQQSAAANKTDEIPF